MDNDLFHRQEDDLPAILPVLAVTDMILMPKGHLPLDIIDPIDVNMITDSLASHRLIGIVQYKTPPTDLQKASLYTVGCAGRITSFTETSGDGQYHVVLTGISRFDVLNEVSKERGYDRYAVSWQRFAVDADPMTPGAFDRGRLLWNMRHYLRHIPVPVNWDALNTMEDDKLLANLTMNNLLDSTEKQALLEAPTVKEQAQLLNTLLEMAAISGIQQDFVRH